MNASILWAISLLCFSAFLLGWQGLRLNAQTALLLSLMLSGIWLLLHYGCKQQRQTELALRALANQDVSFRLRYQPQLQTLYAEVQQQLQLSRQQAEARAHYLTALLAQLEVAVLEFDQHNQLLQANPAAERLLGHELVQQARQGLTAQSKGSLQLLWQKLQQPKASQKGELVWQAPAGHDRLAFSLVHSQLLGQPRKLLTLQSIQQQLLAEEVKAYQQLTRVLTHEIANSINPMVSLAQSSLAMLPAAGDELDHDSHADLTLASQTIARRGEHLSQFIASFQQLSTPVQADLKPVQLAEQLQQVLQLLSHELADIQVELELPQQIPALWLDPALLQQVLINLLKNAFEAMKGREARSLHIKAHCPYQHWLLEMTDSGPGIADSAAEKLFIPFYTTKSSGSGIGLSLARALMQAQGGELQYLPTEQGACFRLRLS
ncbi:MAG: PAS domain-containing protein [Alkalimonas sp.]|nr:PAS domain-containing protein [Alkalimonas sp.]